MIYWAPFLHFYQPPTQVYEILEKVSNESYRPLLKVFNENPNARITINMCGVLTQMLSEHNGQDVIDSIKALAASGKLEFVESAKYHAILPLIPPKEMRRQIELNHQTNSYFFKDLYKPRGFFPPEMCYSDELAGLLSSMGYEWFLAAGLAYNGTWPFHEICKVPFGKSNIVAFYRDDILSNKVSFKSIDSTGFISQLLAFAKDKKDIYVVTAMDAETFGHHIKNWEKLFLGGIYRILEGGSSKNVTIKHKKTSVDRRKRVFTPDEINSIKIVTISELLNIFSVKASQPPLASSWSTSKEDIQKENYYPLWQDASNLIHKLQWDHIDICFKLVNTAHKLMDGKESRQFAEIARLLMDKALHSCQFWWANKGRMWNINMVNRGLILQEEALFNAYKAISVSSCRENIKKNNYRNIAAARDISNKIRDHLLEI